MKINYIIENPFLYKHNKYKQKINIYIYFKSNSSKNLIKDKYKSLLMLLNVNIKDLLTKIIDTYKCKLTKSYLIISTIDDDINNFKLNKNINKSLINEKYYDEINNIDLNDILYLNLNVTFIFAKNDKIKNNINNYINTELKDKIEQLFIDRNKINNILSDDIISSDKSLSSISNSELSLSDLTLDSCSSESDD